MAATLVGTGAGNVTTNSASTGTAITVTKPTNLANDQLIVAILYTRNTGTTFTPPSGWTALGYVGNNCGFAAFGRYIHTASSETATSYTFTSSSSNRWATEAFLVSGVSSNSFADVNAAGPQESGSTTITAPTLTPTADGSLLINCFQGHIASTTVPTMTAPSGTTSVGQFNVTVGPASGSFNMATTLALGTGTGGVATGTKVASLSTAKSNGSTFSFTLNAGSYVPPAPILDSFSVGAPQTDRFVATAVTENVVTGARLAVSTSSSMTSPVYGSSVVPDTNGFVRLTSATTLSADTDYWCQIELDGTLQTTFTGRARTLPTSGAQSYSFAAASCAYSYSNNSVIWDHIRTNTGAAGVRARFFMHLGDMHYDNLGDTGNANLAANIQSYHNVFAQAKQHQLYREMPLMYMASDHDAGGSNVDDSTPNLPYFQQLYRKLFPSYPLVPDSNGDGQGTYHSFAIGRILYILTDGRSYMDSITKTDNSSKTKLGATQKSWLKTQLSSSSYPVKVWFHEDGWNNLSTFTGDDTWSAYNTERTEIGNYISSNNINMIYIHGDFHSLAAETGRNNGWGGFPIISAAPLDQTSFVGNGVWSNGYYPNPVSSTVLTQQYGWWDVDDAGGRIKLTFTGFGINSGLTAMESKLTMANVFLATASSSVTPTASVVGGKALTRTTTASFPVPTGSSTGQKIVAGTGNVSVTLAPTSTGHKNQVTSAKTSTVALSGSAVGTKSAHSIVITSITVFSFSSGGLPGSGNLTVLIVPAASSTGSKRIATTVTSAVVIDSQSTSVVFDYSLTGYSPDLNLDQSATWVATILRLQLGAAVGTDVESLKSLHRFAVIGAIPGQFVPTTDSTAENVSTAAWAIIAGRGGLRIPALPNSLPLPSVPPITPPADDWDGFPATDVFPSITLYPGGGGSSTPNLFPGMALYPGTTVFPGVG